jgi:hypothetical protein
VAIFWVVSRDEKRDVSLTMTCRDIDAKGAPGVAVVMADLVDFSTADLDREVDGIETTMSPHDIVCRRMAFEGLP